METIINYFFPPKETEKPVMEEDKKVYITSGNAMTVIRFSSLKNMNKGELRTWGHKIAMHQAESFDQEECETAQLFLDEIDRLIVDLA